MDFNSATSEPGEGYQHVRATDVTTIVIRVNFKSGADDDITVWLDPDFNPAENEQNPALVTNFTANADFDTICLRKSGKCRAKSMVPTAPSEKNGITGIPTVPNFSCGGESLYIEARGRNITTMPQPGNRAPERDDLPAHFNR